MTDDYLLAVDVGTSGVKALAVSVAGTITQHAWQPYALLHPRPGFAEQQPHELLLHTRKVIQAVRKVCNKPPLAICWSSAMHGIMAIDARNEPLTPLITWADLRSTPQAQELLRSSEAEAVFRAGGTPIHPMAPLCKLMWLRQEAPELFRAAHKFVSIKEYLNFQLTGVWEIDYSLASATALFFTTRLRWNDDALRLAGINAQKLSKPVPTTQQSIIQTDWLGAEWRGIPLIHGASDGCLAQLGSGATAPGVLSITIGTSSAVREMVPTYQLSDHGRLFCYYLNEGQFVRGGASNNGTSAIDWFQNTFSPGTSSLVDFANRLDAVPAGAHGLLFLPYLLGERAPHYHPHAKGAFFGITSAHTQAHFQRAVAEGVCFAVKSIVNQVDPHGHYILRLNGGFARSTVLVQLLANILQQPVEVHPTVEASARGAAILGFSALGVHVSWAVTEPEIYQPDVRTKAVYTDQFHAHQSLYKSVEPLFLSSSHFY